MLSKYSKTFVTICCKYFSVQLYHSHTQKNAKSSKVFCLFVECGCKIFIVQTIFSSPVTFLYQKEVRSEEALTTPFLRRTMSIIGVRAQAKLLLGRLEVIGPGAGAAAGRRNYFLNLYRVFGQTRADCMSRIFSGGGISKLIDP